MQTLSTEKQTVLWVFFVFFLLSQQYDQEIDQNLNYAKEIILLINANFSFQSEPWCLP